MASDHCITPKHFVRAWVLPFREMISETVKENCMMCKRGGCIFLLRWKYEHDSNELPTTAVILEFICLNFLISFTIMCNVCTSEQECVVYFLFYICFLLGHKILICIWSFPVIFFKFPFKIMDVGARYFTFVFNLANWFLAIDLQHLSVFLGPEPTYTCWRSCYFLH